MRRVGEMEMRTGRGKGSGQFDAGGGAANAKTMSRVSQNRVTDVRRCWY